MESPSSSQTSQPIASVTTSFRSIDEFIKEQEALDAHKTAEMKSRASAILVSASPSPPAKRKKTPALDIEAVTAETRAVAELGDSNWIGKLSEYYAAKRVEFHGHSLSYQEIPTGIQARFRFTVTIFERRHEPFGDPKALFTKKIHAKQHASKQAIDWLIANKRMPADGSVRFPKPAPTPTPPKPKSPAIDAAGRPQSNASLVPELCHKLGFGMPKYEIERSSIVAPLYSGYAHFQGDVRLENRIGVVRDVYGQKAAREQIAEELVRFLRDIERQRMALIEKAAGKGKDAREETKRMDESSKEVEEAEEDNKEVEEQIEKELAGSEEERKRKRGPLESPVKDQTEAKISKLIDIDSIQTE